jgi:hypothetical protein
MSENTEQKEANGADTDRRNFISTAASASLLGAIALTSATEYECGTCTGSGSESAHRPRRTRHGGQPVRSYV